MGCNRYCLDYDAVAKKAFAEAATDGEAVLALLLPVGFMNHENRERMVEAVLWMVSTGGEKHKYNTRYFSMKALHVQRAISNLIALKRIMQQIPRITDETLLTQFQVESIPPIANVAVTPQGAQIAVGALGEEIQKYTKQLQHEHVYTKKTLRQRLVMQKESIASVLKDAVGCVVTKEEHRTLKDSLQGWERYRDAQIEVFDRERQTTFRI